VRFAITDEDEIQLFSMHLGAKPGQLRLLRLHGGDYIRVELQPMPHVDYGR
jgi:hypothetical protein